MDTSHALNDYKHLEAKFNTANDELEKVKIEKSHLQELYNALQDEVNIDRINKPKVNLIFSFCIRPRSYK